MQAIRLSAFVATVAAAILFLGCDSKGKDMNDLAAIPGSIKKQLAFACSQEKDRTPPRDPEADQLYKHARWLAKGNILKQDPAAYPPIERLIRIATAYGHDKANIELRGMLEKSHAVSADPVNEIIDLVQDLIKRGVPAGYYDMGWYLEHGYGMRADQELAFKYYRKSADMGSPQGQYLVGDKLSDERRNGADIAKIGWEMYQCAADQLHAKAANELAIHRQTDAQYAEAMKYFQIAAAAGKDTAADMLSSAFSAKSNGDQIFGLGQPVDEERATRYKQISNFLSKYEYLNPVIPEINDIVPLPPAKLSPWNGKYKWLQEHEANVPPPLPSEERITEMARAKSLDPKTGRPLDAGKKAPR